MGTGSVMIRIRMKIMKWKTTSNKKKKSEQTSRDRSLIRPPERFNDLIMTAVGEIEKNDYKPSRFKKAITCHQKDKWLEAIQNEMISLKDNTTWEIVDLPKNRKTLPCMWVYKDKSRWYHRTLQS
ncbi:unnamed protein product [Psylliodes chrysocephalus]|uniref:Reverse transcriptase n=1 Tax=Psylliodes chrysocephalus TaxID=3402493 RepID=A0A9P0CT02_9CUCU|nr:unnamed protein product [Psylliodes chrysocephala]